jgi:ATP-binding cassette subfamily C protein
MDRILAFPCTFFKKFSAGDLATRALGIDQITSQIFQGLVIPSILGAIYASFCFILLFFYDRQLAGIAAILSLVVFLVIAIVTFLQISNQRKEIDIQGELSGFVFQLIQGVSKLKVTGSQLAIFGKWAEKLSMQKKYSYNASKIGNYLSVFNAIMPLMSSIVIFSFVVMQTEQNLALGKKIIGTGDFLAFNAAFGGFLAAIIQLGASIATISGIVSLFERMQPILETLKEDDDKKQDPGELSGNIEVNNLTFRYKEDTPLVLDNLSFSIRPGEFAAFVGPSGSGKSTILRHLLGFETPNNGAVYYDGKDLKTLDLASVRNQIGVVLQDSQLMAGNILYNIIGSSLLTIDDAWEAATMAGIADDIKAMPMGMYTYVGEGAQTFSGGQKQRLLIARAIARKPRIILFDEASSALDNMTQNIVTESINKFKTTRIVIAHRLSTIVKADRIFVVENGKIVQTGIYEDLIKAEGPFKRIAERQII